MKYILLLPLILMHIAYASCTGVHTDGEDVHTDDEGVLCSGDEGTAHDYDVVYQLWHNHFVATMDVPRMSLRNDIKSSDMSYMTAYASGVDNTTFNGCNVKDEMNDITHCNDTILDYPLQSVIKS